MCRKSNYFLVLILSLFVFELICFESINCSDIEIDYDNYDTDVDTDSPTDEESSDPSDECSSVTLLDKLQSQHLMARNHTLVHKESQSLDQIIQHWRNVLDNSLGFGKTENQKLLEFLQENDLGLSDDCSAAYYKIFDAIKNYEMWALKFVDSIGSFPPKGYFEGVFADFGDYDQCLAVESPSKRAFPRIHGKYCVAKAILPYPSIELGTYKESGQQLNDLFGFKVEQLAHMGKNSEKNLIEAFNMINGSIFQLGICMPSVCTPEEVQTMLNTLFYPIFKLPVEVESVCHTKDEKISLDIYQKVCGTILVILAILVLSSTGYDLMNTRSDDNSDQIQSRSVEILQCFSIIRNTSTLFQTTNKFATLDTIRLILILNVHVLHAYLLTYTMGLKTLKKVFVWVVPRIFNDWRYFIIKSPLMIDALFTLSGFLISYSLMRRLHHTKGRLNYVSYLLQQWVRFVLVVFGSIAFYFVFPLFFSGPVWHTADEYMTNGCRNPMNLLKILFFINNFQEFQIEKFHLSCNITLWFMSSLYQFLIISPIFIILYYKRPRLGTYVMGAALCLTLVTTISPFLLFGIKPYVQRLSHGSGFLTSRLNDSLNWFHTTPNNHAFSYFVGIAFGFLMNKDRVISSSRVKLYWGLSVWGIFISYYWNNSFWKVMPEEPQTSALLWHTIGKVIYCMSFGWIYYSCATGRGGLFDKVLSWHGFQPITRLSFGIYLLHYMVVIRRIFIVKQTNYINDRVMIRNLTLDLMLDIVMAFVFYLLIESPFSNIFRILFSR